MWRVVSVLAKVLGVLTMVWGALRAVAVAIDSGEWAEGAFLPLASGLLLLTVAIVGDRVHAMGSGVTDPGKATATEE